MVKKKITPSSENQSDDSNNKEPDEVVTEDENTEIEVEESTPGIKTKFTQAASDKSFKNRRRMAWLSLIAMIAFTVAMMFFVPDAKIARLDGLTTMFFMAMTGVVFSYMGTTTYAFTKGIGKP